MHAMRAAVIALLAASCGRIAFDPLGGDGGGSGSGGSGTLPDATTACVSDGYCPPSCGASDPDCQTVCGDSTCVGNAGELCTTCTSDCKTTANVCGNGACGPGEDGTTCYSDCGPAPWPWTQDAADLFTAINLARTGGTQCAGATSTTTAPAVTRDAGLDAAARDLAWEEAHLGTLGISRCDGQSMLSYFGQVSASSAKIVSNNTQTTTQARMTAWVMDSTSCPGMLMNASYSQVGVAVAVDASPTYIVLFR